MLLLTLLADPKVSSLALFTNKCSVTQRTRVNLRRHFDAVIGDLPWEIHSLRKANQTEAEFVCISRR